MLICIDSGKQMTYTGIISCGENDLFKFYEELGKIFSRKGVYPPFHWGFLTNQTRNSVKPEIERLVNGPVASKIKFNIFIHKESETLSRKHIIFKILPISISQNLSPWLRKISGQVTFEVDNDFNIKRRNTLDFIREIFKNIIPMLTSIPIPIRKERDAYKASVKQKIGNIHLVGKVVDINSSKGVQVIDLILGHVINRKCKFRYDRLFIRKIC